MDKIILLVLFFIIPIQSLFAKEISSISAVTMVGGIIKAQHNDSIKKYNRKDCPVCKGKGWYISGDGIAKVDCGYCEPDKKQNPPTVIVHPPATMKLTPNCPGGVCPLPNKK